MSGLFTELFPFNENVVRNTPLLEEKTTGFDDLIDEPEESGILESMSKQGNDLQFELVYNHAINYVFTQRKLPPSRFGDGSFPIWYASMDANTTFYEIAYHWSNQVLKDIYYDQATPVEQDRSLFEIKCNTLLIDLRSKTAIEPALIEQDEKAYLKTQPIGRQASSQGTPGIYTYSARYAKGENIAIFKQSALSEPVHLEDVIFNYDLKKSKVVIKSKKTDDLIKVL